MPYMLESKLVPEKTEKRKVILFWVVLAINFASVFGYDLVIFIDNEKSYKTGDDISMRGLLEYIALKYSVGVL